jgi:hypothetical protein
VMELMELMDGVQFVPVDDRHGNAWLGSWLAEI